VIRGSVVAVFALPPTASNRLLLKSVTAIPALNAASVGFCSDLSL
jgi:hypothetical protein